MDGENQAPIWNPPPPIIFLTILHSSFANTERRIQELQIGWAKAHNVAIENAKVKKIRKWQKDGKILGETIKKWEEST